MAKIFLVCALLLIVSLAECLEPEHVKFLYKDKAVLDCGKANWSPESIKFYRVYKNDKGVEVDEEVTPYVDAKTGKQKAIFEESTLTLNDLRNYEISAEYYCKSDTSDNKLHFVKEILPFLMHPEKQSQTITEGGVVEFRCDLLYGHHDSLNWKWIRNGTEITSDDKITINSNSNSTTLHINPVEISHKGIISCEATNEFGSNNNEFTLRVKDTLAALWPFLGIVAEVLILCVIILIYEKKCHKKPKSELDNEQSENLMGKESQGGVTKRNTKA